MFLLHEEIDPPIIWSENFLPRAVVKSIFDDMNNIKQYFGTPVWKFGDGATKANNTTTDFETTKNNLNHLCWGSDVWLPDPNIPAGYALSNLDKFFFHQGILQFMRTCKNREFQLGGRYGLTGRTHIISYGNGGYYNWHTDDGVYGTSIFGKEIAMTPVFTMSYTLVQDESLIKGGSQLFMHEGKCYEYPLKNNFLCIFPSRLHHACSEVICDPAMPWENNRFNIQIWTCQDDRN
jgi:hypothetical protein